MKRLAVIDGACSLLMPAIARQLGKRMDVLVVSVGAQVNPELFRVDEVPEEYRQHFMAFGRARTIPPDLLDFLSVHSYWIHTLVNVVGARQEESDLDEGLCVLADMDRNLSRAFQFARAAAVDMVMRRQGVVINVAEPRAWAESGDIVAYETMVGCVEGMTRSLSLELGPRGVRVNSVIPGHVSDVPVADTAPRRRARNTSHISVMGRSGRPDEVADVVDFLASDNSAYVNGVSLRVDGGRHF